MIADIKFLISRYESSRWQRPSEQIIYRNDPLVPLDLESGSSVEQFNTHRWKEEFLTNSLVDFADGSGLIL